MNALSLFFSSVESLVSQRETHESYSESDDASRWASETNAVLAAITCQIFGVLNWSI